MDLLALQQLTLTAFENVERLNTWDASQSPLKFEEQGKIEANTSLSTKSSCIPDSAATSLAGYCADVDASRSGIPWKYDRRSAFVDSVDA